MVFLRRLLHGCATSGGGRPLTAEEDRRLDIGLRGVMELPAEERWLADVIAALPDQAEPDSAAARLRRWEWGRELGWVIDGPRHLVGLSAPLMGFDQTSVLDNPEASGPVMATIFHQSDKLLDGRRFVTVIDEGWRSLLVPAFANLINDSLKTRGKKNAPVIFGTQSPRDALASPIGHTIREQCPGTVAFANPRATLDDYGPTGMGYTEAEVDIIRRLPMGSGLFLYKRNDESAVLQLHLHGLEDDIAVLSGREETVRLLDAMDEATLSDPARLLAAFHGARISPARSPVAS
jgi:type IV secretion system protein VirB4